MVKQVISFFDGDALNQFVIISGTRCGSHFLETALDAHPDIHCYNELFGQDIVRSPEIINFFAHWADWVARDNRSLLYQFRPAVIVDYLRYLRERVPNAKHMGFDLKYYQISEIGALAFLPAFQECKIIHLCRRNILKQFISIVLNKQRANFGRRMHETGSVPQVQIALPNDLVQQLEDLEREALQFKELLEGYFPVLELYYEDLLENGETSSQGVAQSSLTRIYDFLEVQNRNCELHTKFHKMNSSNTSEIVQNFAEVKQMLRGTRFEKFI